MNENQKQQTNPKYLERLKFYEDTVACKKTDRILTAPMLMYLPITLYGETTLQAVMEDYTAAIPSFVKYHEEYQPDLAWGPQCIMPTKPLEVLDCKYIRWPDRHFDDPNRGFQVLDQEYMRQEEYLEYAEDPTGFIMRKILPRHYGALEGLSMLDLSNAIWQGGLYGTIPASLPPVRKAFDALAKSGQIMLDVAKTGNIYDDTMKEKGWPLAIDFVACPPFDIFNDTLRGLLNTTMDMIECPDELLIAIEACTKIQVRTIKAGIKQQNAKTVVFFIHNGMDDFMSLEQYQTFYWPGLKKCLEAVLEMGAIPHIYLEGNYEKKLDIFANELPEGKCIITFIGTDMAKVKEKLTGKVCITGGVDGSLLQYGSKEDVIANVKNAIDICAPGGGYILDCDVSLDLAKAENLHAMYDTARNYMKY